MTRILHVFASLDRGGAESRTMDIYRKIDKSKFQFDFVVNERQQEYAFEREIKSLGGRIFPLPKRKFFACKKMWHELLTKHTEWQIIHIHHTSNAIAYIDTAKSLGRKTIVHSRTAGGDGSLKSYVKMLSRYPLRRKANYLFACSKEAAVWMFGKHSAKAHVIKNAIDISPFAYSSETRDFIRKKHDICDKLVIGHVGRFSPAKNHGFLIDIFAQIHKKFPNAVLLLVGDGSLKADIERRVNENNLEDFVIFTGVRTDVADLLQAMDLFLFPSLFEGLPGSVIEAQAAGLHCLISDTITNEVCITNLVKTLSLGLPPEKWADEALAFTTKNRRDNSQLIRDAGFDVGDVAQKLSEFYCNIDN